MLALVLSGCETTKPTEVIIIPSLEAFRPPYAPDLIANPQTDADLLKNSIAFEYLVYDWQDYAEALEDFVLQIQKAYSKTPP